MLRSWLRLSNLLTALVTVLVCIVGLELASRIFIREPLGLFRQSDVCGYEMVPNFDGNHKKFSDFGTRIQTNSQGLRDRETPAVKSGKRILVLGDSVTFGWGVEVEGTFGKKLEQLLRARMAGVETINAGIWGYNTLQHIEFLKRKGSAYRPDLILVGFTSPVTLERNWYSKVQGSVTVEPLRTDERALAEKVRGSLKRHSHAYSFIDRRWRNRGTILPSWADLKRLAGFGSSASTNPPAAVSAWPETLPENVPVDDAVQETERLLKEVARLAGDLHASVLVAVFPTSFELVEAAAGQAQSRSRKATQALVKALEAASIPAIDLSAGLLPYAVKGEDLFLPRDYVHLNGLGHLRSAEVLDLHLKSRF